MEKEDWMEALFLLFGSIPPPPPPPSMIGEVSLTEEESEALAGEDYD